MQLAEVFSNAKSSQDFYQRIEKKGLQPYLRDGQVVGIINNQKKYRLKTLGFSNQRIANLENEILQKHNPRLKELKQLHNRRSKNKDLGLER
ncbi:hypothetical protein [Lutibacter oricola]|uniref:hypothetical protein n=1 Tax=Lutibacter oricola TaxID=762486 RepID=UPI001113A786|nr:hypothetical protein [Lutibacter oricola]